jgi:uncharacterized protein
MHTLIINDHQFEKGEGSMKTSRKLYGTVWFLLMIVMIAQLTGGCTRTEEAIVMNENENIAYSADPVNSAGSLNSADPASHILSGHFEGIAVLGGEPLWVYLDIANEQNIFLSIPLSSLERLPATVTRRGKNSLEASLFLGMQELRLRLESRDTGWKGTLLVGSEAAEIDFYPGRYSRELIARQNLGRAGEAVTVQTRYGEIHGTLLLPDGNPPFPTVLLIAGSGPTDRDGNSELVVGRSDMLKMAAEFFQEQGYAAMRYDKLGVAESRTGADFDPQTYTFDDAISDAEMLLQYIRDDQRLLLEGVAGHSEGSLIAIALGAGHDDIAWIISLAGNGDPIDVQLVKQLTRQDPALGEIMKNEMERVARGEMPEYTHPVTASLLKREYIAYIRSWMRYNPLEIVNTLEKPMLAVWGTSDERIIREDSLVTAEDLPDVQFAAISGMGHLLKHTDSRPDLMKRSYSDPSLELDPKLLEILGEFLESL